MRFKKIKAGTAGKISLEYEVKKGWGMDEFAMSCVDKALPSFHEALQALSEDVVEICEFPESYRDRILVTGVSFSYAGDNEVMGATIISQLRLAKSNVGLNINTPYKASEFYGETGDKDQLLSEDCVERLGTLQEEAEKYLKGTRAQAELFAKQEAA